MLDALRHVLRVIVLRPVMPVFRALAPNETSGCCILAAGKPPGCLIGTVRIGHELKMLNSIQSGEKKKK